MELRDIPKDITMREYVAWAQGCGHHQIVSLAPNMVKHREQMSEQQLQARLDFLFSKEGYTDDEA